jgi:cellulose biosynthesis protein BcsQ
MSMTQDAASEWNGLFLRLSKDADVVVVDTPAGLYGPTYSILRAASHVVAVLQAETVAHRSFGVFQQMVGSIPTEERPQMLGVLLNMLQASETASVDVLRDACANLPSQWLFDVTIPRHPAFLRASHDGLPLGMVDEKNPPAVAWLFDGLASEVADRLKLRIPEERPKKRLLL